MITDVHVVVTGGQFEVVAHNDQGWIEYRTGLYSSLEQALTAASMQLCEPLVIPVQVRRQHHETRYEPAVVKWVKNL